MSTPARVTFVTVGARDITTLRTFYERVGFTDLNPQLPDFASFLAGGVVLALYEIDKLASEADPGKEPPAAGGWNGVALACNVAEKDQVDAAWQAWVDAGATPIHEPVERVDIGVRSGYVADPEGNRWEIAWAPGLTFDDRGAVTGFGG